MMEGSIEGRYGVRLSCSNPDVRIRWPAMAELSSEIRTDV
jgi:hypothetical protein